MELVTHSKTAPSLGGYRVVLPLASLGNVASLSVDLFIANLHLERTGHLSSRYHNPVVGALDTPTASHVGITTPVELWISTQHHLALVHQRSPPLKARKEDFVTALLDWTRRQQFASVLLLSSQDAARRLDWDLQEGTSPLRHLLFGDPERPLARAIAKLCPKQGDAKLEDGSEKLLIPSGGLTLRLYQAFKEEKALDGGALIAYVVEGDNREDASILGGAALTALGIEGVTLDKQPRSWEAGLYGQTPAQDIYG